MDELIELVAKKTGISQAQARVAVTAVIGFLKDKLPAPLAGQIDTIIAGADLPGNLLEGLGDLFGKK